MLLTYVALGPFRELPLVGSVCFVVEVLVAVLVEDQFGLVYFSCDYNLVNKICAYSADALCRLSLSNYFVIGDSFALLSLDEMLLILLYLD